MVPDSIAYNVLISACEKGKQSERALQIFKAMKQQGALPDLITYTALISACEKCNDFEQALQIFETMKR